MQSHKSFPVSLVETLRAKQRVYDHIVPTQLTHYPNLSEVLGAEIHVKHENHNPTGTFKIRGGVNLMHHLRQSGVNEVITFSTGNHGLSVAQSAAWFGLKATIVVPEGNNPVKNRSIQQTGATLVEAGSTFEEASQAVENLMQTADFYYAHPADEPHILNGVGTEFVEILERLPEVDAVILPIGAGSEVAAAITVLKTMKPGVEIFAVQAESAPAAYQSWRAGSIQTAANTTFAGGFATGTGYSLPFSIYQDQLTDFVLLSEDEIVQGIALAAFYTRNYVEGAGAATLMAAMKLRDRLRGKNVVLQFSGGNASPEEIHQAYALPAFREGWEQWEQ